MTPSSAARWLLVAAAAVSITACASRRPAAELPDPLGQGAAGAAGQPGQTGPGGATGGEGAPGAAGAGVNAGVPASGPGSLQDFVISAGDRVYFETDSHDLRAEAQATLGQQAQWLARYPNVQVIVEGNADERGTREYNLALGARRANTVRDFLVARGVSPARIQTISYGKERPIAEGSDEAAWAKNRNARTNFQGGGY
ncbi:MAG TPA: peptidoglycan-associated lipoprotein Pal [Caulobacteraceae bacterium]|jgi:peptidoglycan-associated lipoprotein